MSAEVHQQPVLCSENGFVRRAYLDLIAAMQDVASRRPRSVQFAVARALQVISHCRNAERFPGGNAHWCGVNSCGGLLEIPGKAQVNHPAKGNPVIGAYECQYESCEGGRTQKG